MFSSRFTPFAVASIRPILFLFFHLVSLHIVLYRVDYILFFFTPSRVLLIPSQCGWSFSVVIFNFTYIHTSTLYLHDLISFVFFPYCNTTFHLLSFYFTFFSSFLLFFHHTGLCLVSRFLSTNLFRSFLSHFLSFIRFGIASLSFCLPAILYYILLFCSASHFLLFYYRPSPFLRSSLFYSYGTLLFGSLSSYPPYRYICLNPIGFLLSFSFRSFRTLIIYNSVSPAKITVYRMD